MENQTVNNNDEVEIDLGEVFHLLLSKLGVIILSGIVFRFTILTLYDKLRCGFQFPAIPAQFP